MGKRLPYEESMVIDYYGYYKKSKGFFDYASSLSEGNNDRQVKSITSTVVHFASLKIEEIALITSNPYLVSKYVEFKKMVLEKRGFRGNGNGV
jgi:hypothetical protein